MKLEEEGNILKCEIVGTEEPVSCRCKQLEERCQKAEKRCMQLELEVQKMQIEYQALEGKVKAYEVDKLSVEKELEGLKRLNNELKNQPSCFDGNSQRVGNCGQQNPQVVDLLEESDGSQLLQLMIENKVLETEKRKAESDVEIWKKKYMELDSCVLQMNSALKGGSIDVDKKVKGEPGVADVDSDGARTGRDTSALDHFEIGIVDSDCWRKDVHNIEAACTPLCDVPFKHTTCVVEEKRDYCIDPEFNTGRSVRKQLSFEKERSPGKKMAPSTPATSISAAVNVIDVNDSDAEPHLTCVGNPISDDLANKKGCITTHAVSGGTVSGGDPVISGEISGKVSNKRAAIVKDEWGENFLCISTPKRKRAFNIVTSDHESDDDDKIPICKLRKTHVQESITTNDETCLDDFSMDTSSGVNDIMGSATPQRRRLATLRQIEQKGRVEGLSSRDSWTGEFKYCQGIPTTGNVKDGESEELQSSSEGESLDGFIVDSSSDSDDDDDDDNASLKSIDESDEVYNFGEILSKLQRQKNYKVKWEFEADMLAAFGKDSELCMKAVCALYRQQTSAEKASKETFCSNGRGFSKFDALRGSKLAEFLTDGDAKGDLKRSVKELQHYDPSGIELCRKFATHYSGQLFQIYLNEEDPFFSPAMI